MQALRKEEGDDPQTRESKAWFTEKFELKIVEE